MLAIYCLSCWNGSPDTEHILRRAAKGTLGRHKSAGPPLANPQEFIQQTANAHERGSHQPNCGAASFAVDASMLRSAGSQPHKHTQWELQLSTQLICQAGHTLLDFERFWDGHAAWTGHHMSQAHPSLAWFMREVSCWHLIPWVSDAAFTEWSHAVAFALGQSPAHLCPSSRIHGLLRRCCLRWRSCSNAK